LFITKKTELHGKEFAAQIFYYILEVVVLLVFIFLFIPGVNPARISEKINRNISLFTSGFFYSVFTNTLHVLLRKSWAKEAFLADYLSAMVADIGILVACTGGVLSFGNNKCRRTGNILTLCGSTTCMLSMAGIRKAYMMLLTGATENNSIGKVKPLFPSAIYFELSVMAILFIVACICFFLTPAPVRGEKYEFDPPKQLFMMLLPFLVLILLFSYLPLWGLRYAFYNYHPGDTLSKDNFVGWYWFTFLFKNPATVKDIIRVLRNTLAMSGLGIATSWCPMVFAMFLAEIRNTRTRRVIQTLTTVPNFISWVLVYAIAVCIFSTDGFISNLMVHNGVWSQGVNMLMNGNHIWLKMLAWGMWKGLGWSAIMYIAAITGIDQQLYEAATVDGAGRFQKMWHVTLPELIPTYMVLLLLSIAGMLNNGLEQYYCFRNTTNSNSIEVLDLYVYLLGLGSGNPSIPLSTVVGFIKSLVSVALLFGANAISKFVRGQNIV
jgi:putative aldouronate transport system permease protein